MWTREWWDIASQAWTLRISDLVLEEASRGDSHAAALRIDALRGIEALIITPDAEALATRLIELQALPPTEPEDALHVALATVSAAHYLVTWNFAHRVGPDSKQDFRFPSFPRRRESSNPLKKLDTRIREYDEFKGLAKVLPK